MAIKGNGPNEFINITNMQVDEKREFLYYIDTKDYGSILCIDLKTGVFMPPCKPDIESFTIDRIDEEGNLYGFPTFATIMLGGSTERPADSTLVYRYNPADHRTTLFKGRHSANTEYSGSIMLRQGKHTLFRSANYSDTLFKIEGDHILPQYVIRLKNQVDNTTFNGNSPVFKISGSDGTIVEKKNTQIDIQRNESDISSISVGTTPVSYLFLTITGELLTLRSVNIDPIALTIDTYDYMKLSEERSTKARIEPSPIISGLWGYYKIEASYLTEHINHAFTSGNLSASQQKVLENISARIDENSNPVLIIGKVR